MIYFKSPLAIVCHDAGAANYILSWLKVNSGMEFRAFMRGPALDLFCSLYPNVSLCNSLEEALEGAHCLITGTGWASDLEHVARQNAKSRGIFNVAVLDHWVNYSERFKRKNQVQLPDEIWVADCFALEIASSLFPSIKIIKKENHYVNFQVAKVQEAPKDGSILVLLEPVRNTWGRGCEGEFQALDYFFENIKHVWPGHISKVYLRPHPSEPANKYQAWLDLHEIASLDMSFDVATAISRADVVVGVESFALTIALAAGRPTFSSLPPWAPALRLPHAGIRQIRFTHKN
jgi:hypothetical protein